VSKRQTAISHCGVTVSDSESRAFVGQMYCTSAASSSWHVGRRPQGLRTLRVVGQASRSPPEPPMGPPAEPPRGTGRASRRPRGVAAPGPRAPAATAPSASRAPQPPR
jgi:hypothetical protein